MQEEVLVGRRRRVFQDVDEGPARESEMHGARRQPRDRVGHARAFVKRARVGPAQRVTEVEQQVVRNSPGLVVAAAAVQRHDQFDEFHGQRRRAQENVALAGDGHGRPRRVSLELGEIGLDEALGLEKRLRQGRRHAHGIERLWVAERTIVLHARAQLRTQSRDLLDQLIARPAGPWGRPWRETCAVFHFAAGPRDKE